MNRIHLMTFGCSLNQADSEMMVALLIKAGYKIVDNPDDANLVIINTCTVKNKTINNFNRTLKQLKGKKIIIAGCIAQTEELEYSTIGTDQINNIADVVKQTLDGKNIRVAKRANIQKTDLPKIRKNKTIEIIPICQGCLGLPCSFCKTKEARGELFSYDAKSIKAAMEKAIEEGAKEIWLTAQDTGAYGKDIGSSLPELLRELLKIKEDYKIRLGMLNPNHLKGFVDQIVEIYKDERMFKFIHIPVQSGNDGILKLMKRQYNIADFNEMIKKIKTIPDMTIATDIIVGFPTETEEQFNDTIKLVKDVRFDVINISRYSARPNTLAAKMPQLESKIITERSRKITDVFRKISLENNKRWIGWKGEVIIDDKQMARNFAYKPVMLNAKQYNKTNAKTKKQSNSFELGSKIIVKIIDAKTFHLIAE